MDFVVTIFFFLTGPAVAYDTVGEWNNDRIPPLDLKRFNAAAAILALHPSFDSL